MRGSATKRHPATESSLPRGRIGVRHPAHDNVVEKLATENTPRLCDPLGDLVVLRTGRRISGRMVVDQDQGRSVQDDRSPEDLFRVDDGRCSGADADHSVPDQPVPNVEHQRENVLSPVWRDQGARDGGSGGSVYAELRSPYWRICDAKHDLPAPIGSGDLHRATLPPGRMPRRVPEPHPRGPRSPRPHTAPGTRRLRRRKGAGGPCSP